MKEKPEFQKSWNEIFRFEKAVPKYLAKPTI
jgi:hypothetical protein